MTSHISNGDHMQLNFKKSVTWVFDAPKHALEDQRPVKAENISLDYSRAHAELMKKPDERMVSSF
jgi:hypothetical protein